MPKNVVCKKCNNLVNDWCEKVIDSPDPDMQRDCQYFCEKTNADKIRALTDEELANVLRIFCIEMADCKDCPLYRFGCPRSSTFNDWMKWLQQPSEEVDHEDRIG